MNQSENYKVKELGAQGSAFAAYRELVYGSQSLGRIAYAELVTTLIGGLGGALGLFLRSKLYPRLFAACGAKAVFGKNITLRHAHKITLGDGVILDDNTVLDAKGCSNRGITVGNKVYVGRNTIIYCKNGDIVIGDRVNFSSNCQVFSSNKIAFGPDTMIGAYSYFLSGGEYDPNDPTPFSKQAGTCTRGELSIGANCWIAARVTVLDAASIGEHCVVGAGAVVNKPLPAHSVAVGIPAKPIKTLNPAGGA